MNTNGKQVPQLLPIELVEDVIIASQETLEQWLEASGAPEDVLNLFYAFDALSTYAREKYSGASDESLAGWEAELQFPKAIGAMQALGAKPHVWEFHYEGVKAKGRAHATANRAKKARKGGAK